VRREEEEVRFGERLTRGAELARSALTSGPGILWVVVFLLLPLMAVGVISFLRRTPLGEVSGPPTSTTTSGCSVSACSASTLSTR
jgi:hypothetical protein